MPLPLQNILPKSSLGMSVSGPSNYFSSSRTGDFSLSIRCLFSKRNPISRNLFNTLFKMRPLASVDGGAIQ
jgi:hypothetical protein